MYPVRTIGFYVEVFDYMKRLLVVSALLLVPVLGFCADETSATFELTPAQVKPMHEVAIRIDPLSEEQIRIGITVEMLQGIIEDQLRTASIQNNTSLQHPTLVLRMRTLQVGIDTATFFQLSYLEEAMLVRNRSLFDAPTWSQASLLACRPEDLKKEALDTVTVMTQAFTKDYAKAMQPTS